jgi:hypothetical protein
MKRTIAASVVFAATLGIAGLAQAQMVPGQVYGPEQRYETPANHQPDSRRRHRFRPRPRCRAIRTRIGGPTLRVFPTSSRPQAQRRTPNSCCTSGASGSLEAPSEPRRGVQPSATIDDLLTTARQRSTATTLAGGSAHMKQAILVAAVLIVVCATFWFASVESWLRRLLRRAAGARSMHQTLSALDPAR